MMLHFFLEKFDISGSGEVSSSKIPMANFLKSNMEISIMFFISLLILLMDSFLCIPIEYSIVPFTIFSLVQIIRDILNIIRAEDFPRKRRIFQYLLEYLIIFLFSVLFNQRFS